MHKKSKIIVTAGFLACTLGLAISCSQNSGPEPTPTDTYKVEFNAPDDMLELLTPVTEVSSTQDLLLQFTLADEFPKQHYYLPKIDDTSKYSSKLQVKTGETTLSYETGFQYEINEDIATLTIPHKNYAGDIVITAQAGKVKHTITIVEDPMGYGLTKHYGFNLINPFNPESDPLQTTAEYYYSPRDNFYSTKIISNVVDFIGEEEFASMGHISYELPEQITVYTVKDGKWSLLAPYQYYYHPGLAKEVQADYYYADFAISTDLLYDDLLITADQWDADMHEIGVVTSSTYIDTGTELVVDYNGIAEFHNNTPVDDSGNIYFERYKDLDGTFNISDEYSGLYKITDLYVYAKEDPVEKSRTLLLPSQYTFIISSAQGWFDDYEAQSATIHIDNMVTMNYWDFEFELIVTRVENTHKINAYALDSKGEPIYPEEGGPILQADPVYIEGALYIDIKNTNDRYQFCDDTVTNNIRVGIDVDIGGTPTPKELVRGVDISTDCGYSYEILEEDNQQYGRVWLGTDSGSGEGHYDIDDITADGNVYIFITVVELQ